VQQAVDAAEVHEGAVLGDVLDRAREDLALLERLERLVLRSAFSSSRTALRESTMLPRFLLTLITRIRSSCPLSASRLRTGRTSTWLPGRKARTPMSTARPPFTRSMTRPTTTRRSW
jgi:hypothetical protein